MARGDKDQSAQEKMEREGTTYKKIDTVHK